MDLTPRFFLLVVLRIALIPLLLLAESAIASTLTYYPGKDSSRHSSHDAACKSYSSNYQSDGNLYCKNGFGTIVYTIYPTTTNCPYGHTGLYCNAQLPSCDYGTFDPVGNSCPTPPACNDDEFQSPINGSCLPKPQCPSGGSFDANMNGGEGGCACGAGLNSVSLDGFTMCLPDLADDVCTSSSSDFAGYMNGVPICPGRNRCPDGTQPGYVGEGDQVKPVCYPKPGQNDPSCDGTSGVVDGQTVCIPKFGNDPNCPMGSGVINGQTVCIPDPTKDPDCPGGVAGYAGAGDQMVKTCVDPGYKPPTCPPGQYTLGTNGGGFGCVTIGTQPPKDPTAPPKPGQVVTGTVGGSGGTGGTGGDGGDGGTGEPCPEGQNCSQQQISIKLPEGGLEATIEGLFEDAPNVNYKKDLDEFGQSELDGVLNPDMHFADVRGPDGLFTERNRLEQFTAFVKTHTVGNSTSCNGSLPFLGMSISCEKFSTYNRIIGYMLSVFAMLSIYKTLMRPSGSGV